jgi:pyrimidine-nucleoside phosphorylase
MRAIDIIAHKRDGQSLSAEEIDFFVQGFSQSTIPDYQAAAWLMAVFLRGMGRQETVDLTTAMVRSGVELDLSEEASFVVDKHSTGGVGDKTTLVVAPLVAAAGVQVAKLSGRGLGFTGGTLDKLESIPGFRADLSIPEFQEQLGAIGIVVTGQSSELAPADGKLYALRDVTATVGSMPLIASSIMSKKIAGGADGIVLDVKVGHGAFMKTREDAAELASLMVDIGNGLGRRVRAVLSDMNQPLGRAVGNALELREALDTLQGHGPQDFRQHCLVIASQMLSLAGQGQDQAAATDYLAHLLVGGQALAKFREWIAAQGGDISCIEDPSLLPTAKIVREVPSPHAGYLRSLDAREIGLTAMLLGGGRVQKSDLIDHAVGVELHAKIGDQVEKGQRLFTLYANEEARLPGARQRMLSAYDWSEEPVTSLPLIHRIIH